MNKYKKELMSTNFKIWLVEKEVTRLELYSFIFLTWAWTAFVFYYESNSNSYLIIAMILLHIWFRLVSTKLKQQIEKDLRS